MQLLGCIKFCTDPDEHATLKLLNGPDVQSGYRRSSRVALPQSQFLRFAVVGTLGFLVDTAVLLTLARLLAMPPVPARVCSFLCAATATYLLNRRFTFRAVAESKGRWLPYVCLAALGAMINIGVYRAWISTGGQDAVQLVVGSALGSVAAMFFNFFTSRALFRA
jgi:putative flippase GtrA